ncbi:MAG: hypothetical protein ABJO01_09930 [Parasphingorhabdus sp.]|uniref:hypothetical protein n=1 Tax=Parasphingorhabdus sp. TaxID=2709688 RepID=UPI00329814AF
MIERLDKSWVILGLSAALMIGIPWWLLSAQPEDIPEVAPLVITKVEPQEIVTAKALFEKPLFNARRAPQTFADQAVADNIPAVEQAQPVAPAPTLVGLVSRRRGKSVAIVKDRDGQTKTLAPGQSADGWRLVSVSKTKARFASAGSEISIALDFTNKALGGPGGVSEANSTPQENEPVIGEIE